MMCDPWPLDRGGCGTAATDGETIDSGAPLVKERERERAPRGRAPRWEEHSDSIAPARPASERGGTRRGSERGARGSSTGREDSARGPRGDARTGIKSHVAGGGCGSREFGCAGRRWLAGRTRRCRAMNNMGAGRGGRYSIWGRDPGMRRGTYKASEVRAFAGPRAGSECGCSTAAEGRRWSRGLLLEGRSQMREGVCYGDVVAVREWVAVQSSPCRSIDSRVGGRWNRGQSWAGIWNIE
ncbi:hypothetical protein BC628DRAFT_366655 [Trametes gibbosa]|nr:hypothetical protein BC628DRAFT_366655 [Trametes gibbosa]